jgi:5-methylcytosine-specific restriction enzyme A
MYVAPVGRPLHLRSRDSDFKEFLFRPNDDGPWQPRVGRGVSAELDDTVVGLEGERRLRLVYHRHRERALRRAKIEAVLGKRGCLRCEVPGCGFDFADRYGSLGAGYAQVHHLKQLARSDEPVETRLEDLAIVCANCHMMIHRDGDNRPLEGLVVKP